MTYLFGFSVVGYFCSFGTSGWEVSFHFKKIKVFSCFSMCVNTQTAKRLAINYVKDFEKGRRSMKIAIIWWRVGVTHMLCGVISDIGAQNKNNNLRIFSSLNWKSFDTVSVLLDVYNVKYYKICDSKNSFEYWLYQGYWLETKTWNYTRIWQDTLSRTKSLRNRN